MGIFIPTLVLLTLAIFADSEKAVSKTPKASHYFANPGGMLDILDILKKFDLCTLTCKGKSCECCQYINMMVTKVPVCGSALFHPPTGVLDVSVQVGGKRVLGTKVNVGTVIHNCQTFNTTLGKMEVCVDAAFSDDKKNPNAFSMSAKAEVSYNKVKALLMTFNMVNIHGDISLDGQAVNGAKTVGTVKILNPLLLINEARKTIVG